MVRPGSGDCSSDMHNSSYRCSTCMRCHDASLHACCVCCRWWLHLAGTSLTCCGAPAAFNGQEQIASSLSGGHYLKMCHSACAAGTVPATTKVPIAAAAAAAVAAVAATCRLLVCGCTGWICSTRLQLQESKGPPIQACGRVSKTAAAAVAVVAAAALPHGQAGQHWNCSSS